MKFRIPIPLMFMIVMPLMARDFAVVEPQQYSGLVSAGWNIAAPLWSPDSSRVLFDMQGNVDFSSEQHSTLDSLQAEIISNNEIQDWLIDNNWIEEEI